MKLAIALMVPTVALLACSGGGDHKPAGSGGASGGTVASGGSGTGGASASGGAATGGVTSTSAPASGGATGTGGSGATGGRGGGGGVTLATGGSVATGGAVTTGGTTRTGGAGAGGVSRSGGTVGTGGVSTGANGGTGVGGTISMGGSAAGGGSGNGGASGGRRDGACQAGVSYPAPVLTGTPKLLSKPSGSGSGTYEGAVWLATGAFVLFSDVTFTTPVNPSQILKLTPPSTVATFLADSGTNGMALDGSGTVFACSHKVQGIVKLDVAAATLTTVVDNIGGKKFNSPNDLVIRSDGTIYFTDPDYQLGSRTSETGKKAIYRVSPSGAVSVVDDSFNEPNGIALSPDESVLYVADYAGNAVRTFVVATDGSTSGRKDFASVSSPDGFGMDCLGNLYVASGSAGVLQVYAPSGSKLGSVTVAASLSNAAFGGPDGKTLYLTAGKALYSLDMNLPGYFD